MGKEPALELDAVFGGAFARLQFVQGGFGAVDEGFVVDDRGIKGCDEFERLVSPSMRSVKKSGSSAARARSWSRSVCLASSSWLSAKRGSRVMNTSRRRGPGGRDAQGIAVAPASPDAGNSMWGAGNLQTGAPSGSFVSARTHKLSLFSTASSRSAYHPIATR